MLKLITHDGKFHYDEVLSTAILKMIYKDAIVIRSRNKSVISSGDIVYDVGGIIDPKKNRYDHHMKTFTETFNHKYNIKLSSSGLIYKYFHKKLFILYKFTETHPLFDMIVDKIYSEFFLWADANDNGYDVFGNFPCRKLSDFIRYINHFEDIFSPEQESSFFRAVEIVQLDLKNYLSRIFTQYLPSYQKVYDDIRTINNSIYITSENVSMDLIYDVDQKLNASIKFVVYSKDDGHRVVCMSVSKESFKSRILLKKEWRGLRGEELAKISGYDDIIFVHATGFTGGALSLSTTLKMCEESVEAFNKL